MQIKSFRVFPPKVGHGFYRQEIVIGKIRVQPIAVETKVVGGFGKLVRQITNRHSICRKVLCVVQQIVSKDASTDLVLKVLVFGVVVDIVLVIAVDTCCCCGGGGSIVVAKDGGYQSQHRPLGQKEAVTTNGDTNIYTTIKRRTSSIDTWMPRRRRKRRR